MYWCGQKGNICFAFLIKENNGDCKGRIGR